jgi:hypothetical protein
VERSLELLSRIFADATYKESFPWYQFSSSIDEFNSIFQSEVVGSQ